MEKPPADLTQHQPRHAKLSSMPQIPLQLRYLWLTAGVLVGLGLLTVLWWSQKPAAPPQDPQARWQRIREQAWETIQPRLQEADQAVQALADSYAAEVEQFFEQRKAGAQGFAATVLSWQSKWRLIVSTWPSADREGHRKFIAAQFAQYIFTADDLQRVVAQAVAEYMHGIEGIENQLLVAIRADLADFPQAALPGLDSARVFQSGYAHMLAEVEQHVQTDLKIDVVRESSSLVAGEVAAAVILQVVTAVARRLGMSTGILGTGAASATVTFGVGLVAGMAVDAVADWVIRWYYNPQGKIAEKVTAALDHMKLLLVQGDAQTVGLKAELEQLGASRARMRNVALAHLVRHGG